jgi:beta-glucosidase
VNITNKGSVDTEEVVQVYVENKDKKDAPPNPILGAFKRVKVPAGETITEQIIVKDPAFTVVDNSGNRIHSGSEYAFYIGCSGPDKKSVELTGHAPVKVGLSI